MQVLLLFPRMCPQKGLNGLLPLRPLSFFFCEKEAALKESFQMLMSCAIRDWVPWTRLWERISRVGMLVAVMGTGSILVVVAQVGFSTALKRNPGSSLGVGPHIRNKSNHLFPSPSQHAPSCTIYVTSHMPPVCGIRFITDIALGKQGVELVRDTGL